jgi:hypothetical protein
VPRDCASAGQSLLLTLTTKKSRTKVSNCTASKLQVSAVRLTRPTWCMPCQPNVLHLGLLERRSCRPPWPMRLLAYIGRAAMLANSCAAMHVHPQKITRLIVCSSRGDPVV